MANVAEKIFELDANTSKIIKELLQLKGVYQELTDEQVKQVAELKELELAEKKLKAARDASNNPTAYIRINKQIDENTKKLGALKETVDKFTASNVKAKTEADALGTSLSNAFKGTQVNAVKGAVTQFNTLGNSINQISRELPAFAVSANTGFLAISNNLPIFFDALEKVKNENAALASQGKKTTSVLSQIGSAIFSTSGLLSIGVTLFTLYGAKLIEATANLFKSTDALNLNTEAMELNNKAIENSTKNQEDLIALREKNYVQTLNDTKKISDVEKKFIEALEEFDKRKIEIDKRRKEDNISIVEAQLRAGDKEVEIVRKVEGDKIRILNKATGESIKLNKDGTALAISATRSYGEESISLNEKFIEKNIQLRDKLYGRELRDLELFYDSAIEVISSGEEKARKAKKQKTEKTVDLSDRIRQLKIDDIKVEKEREAQQAEFDIFRAIREVRTIKASEAQKKELILALKNDLINKLEAIDKKYLDKQTEESVNNAHATAEAMNNVLEDNANTEIYIAERKIKKLQSENKKANDKEIKNLKVLVYEKKKLLLDLQESAEISGLKQNEQGQINEAERYEIEVEYANKRKKLEFELLDSVAEKNKKTNKEKLNDNVKYFADLLKAVIDATNQIISLKIKEVDSQTSLQQKRVDEAKAIADRGNSQQLELEQKRLDDLNKKREQYVRQQQALAAVELVANTAIAVSKAAAQGGVAAGVTIAAALIALVAGLASARSIASQAAYYDGGYTGDGNPRDESRTMGGRRTSRPYIWHKGEFVMDHKKTRKYRDIFEDVHAGKVDLREWQEKAAQYDLLQNRREFMLNQNYAANQGPVNIDFSSMEKEMKSINENLRGLYFGLNVDENGFTMRQRRILDRKTEIRNNAKL